MQEPTVRKWHRYIGVVVAPMVVLQALSGLFLTVEALHGVQKFVHSVISGRHLPSVARFWDFLMVEIHFGGGLLGQVYNVALATGLIALAVSGVIVFVKVQERLRRRTVVRPAVPPGPATSPGQPSPPVAAAGMGPHPGAGESLVWKRLHLLLVTATVGMTVLLAVVYYEVFRITAHHSPLAEAAIEIRLEATRAHLWFEEILSGDTNETMDTVWQSLDRSEWYARAMLEGEERGDGSDLTILPLADLVLRERIQQVRTWLAEFRDLTRQRYEATSAAGPGSPLDQEYDRVFRELGIASDGVKAALKQAIQRDRGVFQAIQLVLLSASILLGVFVWVAISKLQGDVNKRAQEMEAARAKMDEERQLFGQLIQQAADPLLVLDREGRIIDVNRAACAALGYPADQIVGVPLFQIETAHSRQGLEELWGQLVPGAPVSMKGVHRRRDGTTFPVEVNLRLLEWGSRWLVVALARDVTERLRAERELQETLEKLQQALRQRTAELAEFERQAPPKTRSHEKG